MKKVATVPSIVPQVQKKIEFDRFMSLVRKGLWKNTGYIAELCTVDRGTIAEWKKRPEVIEAHFAVSESELQKWQRVGKVEDRLKEQGMEFEPEKTETKITFEVNDLEVV